MKIQISIHICVFFQQEYRIYAFCPVPMVTINCDVEELSAYSVRSSKKWK